MNLRFALRSVSFLLIASMLGCETTSYSGGYTLKGVPPPPSHPIRDTRIVPGRRIGPVALGIGVQDLLEAMGEPDQHMSTPKLHLTNYQWYHSGLSVTVADNLQRVVLIEATNPAPYELSNGIGIGSSELSVRAALGLPNRQRIFEVEGAQWQRNCYAQGLLIEFRRGEVAVMTVVEPGC